MTYPMIEINLDKIKKNAQAITALCAEHHIQVAGVTKVTCGSPHVAQALLAGGVRQVADSRLENIARLRENGISGEMLLLRIPMPSQVADVVALADLSLNSELAVISALSREALRRKKKHKVIIMIDVGDLREGILPDDTPAMVKAILALDGVTLEGIGTNLSCYGGIIPTIANMQMLAKLADRIERQFRIKLNLVSGGNTSSLRLVMENKIPARINHLRIGEGILLGLDSVDRKPLTGTVQDAFLLKAEVIELNCKPTVPIGQQGQDAFGQVPQFEDRGIRTRAILGVGREDIDAENIHPLDTHLKVLGASSDHLLVDVQDSPKAYRAGDVMAFGLGYRALLAAMTSPYVMKSYTTAQRTATRRHITILGVPTCLGGSDQGVALAPDAIRRADLARILQGLGYTIEDLGNISQPGGPVHSPASPLKNLEAVVAVCEVVAQQVAAICRADSRPLVLGGDHTLTMGVLAGLRQARDLVGLIYFDAHGDFNTDRTTLTQNIHGMVVSACVGLGHPALVKCCGIHPKVAQENVVMIGVRNIDPQEQKNLCQSRIKVFTMEDIDLIGMREVINQSIAHLAHCAGGVHVSLDLGVVDCKEAPGVSLPVRGGISYRETHLAMELLSQSGLPFSADVVEINPAQDMQDSTSRLAVEFIGSLFGKRII